MKVCLVVSIRMWFIFFFRFFFMFVHVFCVHVCLDVGVCLWEGASWRPKSSSSTLPALLCGKVSQLNPELPDKPLLTNQLAGGSLVSASRGHNYRQAVKPTWYLHCLLSKHFKHWTISPAAVCCDRLSDRAVGDETVAFSSACKQTCRCMFRRKKMRVTSTAPNEKTHPSTLRW